MKIGAHIWVGKGLVKTVETAQMLGCGCFQIFLQNPRSWTRRKRPRDEVLGFIKAVKNSSISPVVVHMPYLLNLPSPDKRVAFLSRALLEEEMEEAKNIGADFYVMHPGSHKGEGLKAGMKKIAAGIKPFIGSVPKILLENTAGQGDTIGGRWEDFRGLFQEFGSRVGVCLDTAHAFQSGYNIKDEEEFDKMAEEIKKNLGLQSVCLIHANDSASPLGSKLDRHQHIGEGCLGKKPFELLIKDGYFGSLPFIIETPKSDMEADRKNLDVLKKIGKKYGKI